MKPKHITLRPVGAVAVSAALVFGTATQAVARMTNVEQPAITTDRFTGTIDLRVGVATWGPKVRVDREAQAFLASRNLIYQLGGLLEAIAARFPDAPVALSMLHDPEEDVDPEVQAVITWGGEVDEALSLLDAFDDAYWFTDENPFGDVLSVHVEYE